MPNRPAPSPALRLALALASLLLAILLGPGPVADSPQADRTSPHLARSSPPAIHLGAATPADNAPQIADVPTEEEEQDRVEARDESRAPSLIPPSFLAALDHRLTGLRSAPSLYPLRC